MTPRILLGTVLVVALGAPCSAHAQTRDAKLSVNDLNKEVAALQVLHYFRFTPEQMKRLQKLAPETADKHSSARAGAKVSEAYRKALESLRLALIKADDDDRIAELEEQVEGLREKEKPSLDDEYEISDEARRRAPEVLRTLFASQVTAYLNTFGEDIPDPTESLLGALNSVRGMKEEQWKELREEIRDQVGRLAAGVDETKATRVSNEAVQFLIRVRSIKDDKEFQAKRTALEREARQTLGNVSPIDVLRNIAEVGLAELLSNPRLERALAARLKGG